MAENILCQNTSPTLELEPGDVALLIKSGPDGSIQIHHNIKSIEENGVIDGNNGDAAGIMMALTMNDLMENDEKAFIASMTRVANAMQGPSLKLIQ